MIYLIYQIEKTDILGLSRICALKMQSASVDTHAVEQYLTCYLKRYTHTQKQANKQTKQTNIYNTADPTGNKL